MQDSKKSKSLSIKDAKGNEQKISVPKSVAEQDLSTKPKHYMETKIPIGYGNWTLPVRYIDVGLMHGYVEEKYVKHLASYICSLTCRAFDSIRGNFPIQNLQKQVTSLCLERLILFAQILSRDPIGIVEHSDATVTYPPIIPTRIEIFVIESKAVEAMVSIIVMGSNYQANIRLEMRGSRWICSMLDIG